MVKTPVLDYVHKRNLDVDLTNSVVLACQHMLEGNAASLTSLYARGLQPQNLLVLPKVYSYNREIARELKLSGAYVHPINYDSYVSFDRQMSRNIEKFLAKAERKDLNKFENLIVIDDGGALLSAVNTASLGSALHPSSSSLKLYGVEQTSSGYNRLLQENISFPVANVARSYAKLAYETPFIADYAVNLIEAFAVREQHGQGGQWYGYAKEARALVVGCGSLGRAVAQRLSKHRRVFSYDPKCTQQKLDCVLARLDGSGIIIGASGSRSLPCSLSNAASGNHLFMSLSSSDREFDAVRSRRNERRFQTIDSCHYNCNSRGGVLVNGGFPITFLGHREQAKTEKMELTHALILEGLFECMKQKKVKNGFFSLDRTNQADIVQTWRDSHREILAAPDKKLEFKPYPWTYSYEF